MRQHRHAPQRSVAPCVCRAEQTREVGIEGIVLFHEEVGVGCLLAAGSADWLAGLVRVDALGEAAGETGGDGSDKLLLFFFLFLLVCARET